MLEDSAQLRTLRAFTLLHLLRADTQGDWRGSLIVNLGLSEEGTAFALASHIAGAVCLTIEENSKLAHAALRTGACDFVVNTLDEALRAMKNEIRKHQPLSVGLQANLAESLQEILARGVAPQLIAGVSAGSPHTLLLRTLQSHGATLLHFAGPPPVPGAIGATSFLSSLLSGRQWTAHDFSFPNLAAVKSFDAAAATILSPDDSLRRTWLTTAPRLFSRERPPHRVLWLTRSEQEQLQKKLESDSARQ
jgi:urocanate hydratase